MDAELINLLSIGIVGVGFSLLIKWLKGVLNLHDNGTKALVVALSLVLGIAFYIVRQLDIWGSFLTILGISQTVYAFFIKKSDETLH